MPPVTLDGVQASDDSPAEEDWTVKVTVWVAPPALALRVAKPGTELSEELTVKLALERPAATVTAAGRATTIPLALRATAAPPGGARPFNWAVQASDPGISSVVPPQLNDCNAGGFTVTVTLVDWPLEVAVTVTGWVAATAEVVAENPAEVAAAATVTAGGTETAAWLLERLILRPPDGALPASVTVQAREAPPVTVDGVQTSDDRATGPASNVKLTLRETPPAVAVTVAVPAAAVSPALTVKLPLVAAAATVAEAAIVTAAPLELSATMVPPAGAGPFNCAVQLIEPGIDRVVPEQLSDCSAGGLTVTVVATD